MMSKIKYLVYTSDLENHSFIKKNKEDNDVKCISSVDSRSAVYLATGIAAQNKEAVMVCIDSGNSSRSAFSGMTEAFYRQLPVVLVTFGNKLDYSKELGDVVFGHYKVNSVEEISSVISYSKPIHIEVSESGTNISKIKCNKLQELLYNSFDEKTYLYIGQGIEVSDMSCKCKKVLGGMPDCYEGALANVLGASLAKLKDRYIGLVSEEEFIHDINTLGNININDLVFYIVVCEKKNDMILNFADSLQFKTDCIKEDKIEMSFIRSLAENKSKTLLIVYKED